METVGTDATLGAEVQGLVARYGKAAVLMALEALKVRPGMDATREEKASLAALIDKLFYPCTTFNPFAFLQKQKAAGIPVKVSLEILERIIAVRPQNPWALVETIMRKDYPGQAWGRRLETGNGKLETGR